MAAAVALAGCSPAGAGPGAGSKTGPTRPSTTTTSVPPTTAPPARGDIDDPATVPAPSGNLPDPFVLKVPGGYQLYASQASLSGAIIPTAFSSRFGRWPATHGAMTKLPPWATVGFTWAPDVRYLDGEYVMYFDALAKRSLYYDAAGHGLSNYAQCIGTATSKTPGGPFAPRPSPLICDFHAHGAIDPRTFLAPDGKLYLDWKSDNNAANPAPFPATHLFAQLLAANGLSLAGRPHLLMSADERWQGHIVEAPDMVVARGRYWLFYSGSWFNNTGYGIGYARCSSPTGPCTDISVNGPFIGSNKEGVGPGEESLFEGTNGDWWLLYAPWYFDWLGRANRPIAIAPVAFGARPYVAAPAGTAS
ncbi:MAG: glycoside hydrolase family 43 protein [Acidimicrobiales bacterium]|jgi:beta-xylosidase